MTAQQSSQTAISIAIPEFSAAKQTELFEKLKQSRFSGQVVLINPQGDKAFLYLYLGRTIYATGGIHPVRRWRRNLVTYCPQIAAQPSAVQLDLTNIDPEKLRVCWEYELLCLWVEQQKTTREQAAQLIRSAIAEILFDLTQTMKVTCELRQNIVLQPRLALIDAEQVVGESQKLWQAWQGAKIADRSPNRAPTIKQAEQLKAKTSPQVYQTLSQLLDGQQTLRDLSVRMKRDVLAVTTSLLPYIQLGLVELSEVADLSSPIAAPGAAGSGGANPASAANAALIACIDDSPLMCQTMEKILTSANYQFVGINDPLRAIAILLARKPDLIFLDLVMPNANGYEICSQLRRMTFFRDTPIIILTGNDGIVDRVRAKMVGSSDFISKPVDPEVVLDVINRHLHEKVATE